DNFATWCSKKNKVNLQLGSWNGRFGTTNTTLCEVFEKNELKLRPIVINYPSAKGFLPYRSRVTCFLMTENCFLP
uniref:Uncharacterized protein n=1 Tax=Aegilops tauschii subsp. strangulata TaxID=200361 RepID=A0A453FEG3_AEGTS